MTKTTKFFDLFHKKQYAKGDETYQQTINSLLLKQYIEKAIRFIKVKQFNSGFPEIFSPEQGGEIAVVIQQDAKSPDLFNVDFSYMTIPGHDVIFRDTRLIDYTELKRLAMGYDQNKEQIDQELSYRSEAIKSLEI